MCSVTAVLFFTIGGINLFNFIRLDQNSDRIISLISEGNGVYPFEPDKSPEKPSQGITKETPFEVRYFSIVINADGTIKELYLQKIASISPDQAVKYASDVYNSNKTTGRKNGYKYLKTTDGDTTLIVFLDCQKDIFTLNTFLFLSVLIGVSGLIAVFLLILLLSKIALKPAEESYHKQKAFITNAGHDLKTPLAVINAEADVLELDVGKNESTREIKKQVSVLDSLIKKLIFLAKMEEVENYTLADFNLTDSLNDVLSGYETVFTKKGFLFESDVQSDVIVKGNAELLSRAFTLILDNALKYTDENGKIAVSLKKNGKNAKIVFYNDAKNVTPGKHDELFERFYRGDKSRNADGNGIGLSVVKAITDINKAKITAEASAGGISFIITL